MVVCSIAKADRHLDQSSKGKIASVPRHREIEQGTVRSILQATGNWRAMSLRLATAAIGFDRDHLPHRLGYSTLVVGAPPLSPSFGDRVGSVSLTPSRPPLQTPVPLPHDPPA